MEDEIMKSWFNGWYITNGQFIDLFWTELSWESIHPVFTLYTQPLILTWLEWSEALVTVNNFWLTGSGWSKSIIFRQNYNVIICLLSSVWTHQRNLLLLRIITCAPLSLSTMKHWKTKTKWNVEYGATYWFIKYKI